jgi:hypothetical protein
MEDGDPLIIGDANSATNPGAETSLSRNDKTPITVFAARSLHAGDAIHGEAIDGSGVFGRSDTHEGVVGFTNSGGGVVAFSVSNNGVEGLGRVGVLGSGRISGVLGAAPTGLGVLGGSTSGVGVAGSSDTGFGVQGSSRSSVGVAGRSDTNIGVR